MNATNEQAARARVRARGWKPRNCVWELTLACNLDCQHCGSRAGKVRARELSLDECLDVAEQLADLGCELVTLSGGEPTLRKGWDRIARALVDRGIYTNMVTNGVYPRAGGAAAVAERARAAGMCNVAVSVDGPRAVHDRVRGEGAFDATLASARAFRDAGLPVSVLTTVSRLNLGQLEAVREVAIDAGARQWRLQLAKPMGRMGDHAELMIKPTDLLGLVPRLARLKQAGGIELRVGDSIGYYGPYDKVLRGRGWRGGRRECWQGCQAGMHAIGIEADGGVKGCLSLQAKWGDRDPFVEGNVRERTLDEIWHAPGVFAFNRDSGQAQLTGGCARCRYGAICRGGARCVSSAVNGTVTDDPYCYHRVATEARADDPRRAPCLATATLAMSMAACVDGGGGSADTDGSLVPRDAVVKVDGVGLDGPVADAAPDAAKMDAASLDQGATDGPPPDALTHPDGPLPDGPLADGAPDGPAPDAAPDVSVSPPDAGIDCSAVCCECEYGIIPPEIWEACCAPDPCADVCCECDYGDPPPPECCE